MQLSHCHVCGEKLGSRIHNFYSRTQKMSLDGETKIISVLHELQEMPFCGQECWGAMEEAITEGSIRFTSRCASSRRAPNAGRRWTEPTRIKRSTLASWRMCRSRGWHQCVYSTRKKSPSFAQSVGCQKEIWQQRWGCLSKSMRAWLGLNRKGQRSQSPSRDTRSDHEVNTRGHMTVPLYLLEKMPATGWPLNV